MKDDKTRIGPRGEAMGAEEPLMDLSPPPEDDLPMMFRTTRSTVEGAKAGGLGSAGAGSGGSLQSKFFNEAGKAGQRTSTGGASQGPSRLNFTRPGPEDDPVPDLEPLEDLFSAPQRKSGSATLKALVVGGGVVILVGINAVVLWLLPSFDHKTDVALKQARAPLSVVERPADPAAAPRAAIAPNPARPPASAAPAPTLAPAPSAQMTPARPAPARQAPAPAAKAQAPVQPSTPPSPPAQAPQVKAGIATPPAPSLKPAPKPQLKSPQGPAPAASPAPRPTALAAARATGPASPAAAPALKGVVVQLGALKSDALADDVIAKVIKSVGDAPSSLVRGKEHITKDGDVLVRALLGGFASRADATAFCVKAKAAGAACFVRPAS